MITTNSLVNYDVMNYRVFGFYWRITAFRLNNQTEVATLNQTNEEDE